MESGDLQAYLDLVDWRRRVGDLYRLAAREGLEAFRAGRDELMRSHPQSPLPPADRDEFTGLRYFPSNPAFRVSTRLEAGGDGGDVEIDTGGPDGVIHYRRAGIVRFAVAGHQCRLTVFSLVGYGGGLFLPFRDRTSAAETYGGGRYLFDTIKNTDAGGLELDAGSPEMKIDFNYAYNPSCAYDHRWACPLAPRENWLDIAIEAGELVYSRV